MTDPAPAAHAIAQDAAERSDVDIVEVLSQADIAAALRIVELVWQPDPANAPITAEVLRALIHAGSYATLAIDRSDATMFGFCLAFPSLHPAGSLHSHMAGVIAAGAGRHIGYALKLHQRAWALDRGIDLITWTHDPLVLRNAWFNAGKLGAYPTGYLVDFYGDMADAVNAGQGSDRLVAGWHLTAARTTAILDGQRPPPPAEVVAALRDVGGEPLTAEVPGATAISVAVPGDIEALRQADPERARRWRFAVREQLGERMAAGWSVTAVDRRGWYVLERRDEENPG